VPWWAKATALPSGVNAAHQTIQLSRPSSGRSRRTSLPVVNSHEQAGSSSSLSVVLCPGEQSRLRAAIAIDVGALPGRCIAFGHVGSPGPARWRG